MKRFRILAVPLSTAALGACVVGACGGDPFVLAELASAKLGDGGAGGSLDGSITADGSSSNTLDGGGGVDGNVLEDGAVIQSPCGNIRTADSPAFDREVCFSSDTFTMGSSEANFGTPGFYDHSPPHNVTLSKFALDAYEVTVGRYRQCVNQNGCVAPTTGNSCTYSNSGNEDQSALPVTCVTWAQASTFCLWDGNRRLPTEAEWEFAARGKTDRKYPWGSDFDCSRAVIAGGNLCPEYTGFAKVGSKPLGATPEHVFDMGGNAAEWVADWMGSYGSGNKTDPTGPSIGTSRGLRGGSFSTGMPASYVYARMGAAPLTGTYGFRCARSVQ